MGLYLRKSFRAGPIRFNVSRSGIGVSGGVKGARLGSGPRGTYIHGGRYGLYYRKNLKSPNSQNRANSDGQDNATVLLLIIGAAAGIWLLTWLIDNPKIFIAGVAVIAGSALIHTTIQLNRKKHLKSYKNILDSVFVSSHEELPSATQIANIRDLQKNLPKNTASLSTTKSIETDIYHAILDKILDDGFITDEEANIIATAEDVLHLELGTQINIKKEIFSSAYLEAIQDREITEKELNKLHNLIKGLAIPQNEIQHELEIVNDIVDAQKLQIPLPPVPESDLVVRIQKSEKAFYQAPGSVLSKRKSRNTESGYEYVTRREGTLVVTNKRVLLVGEGTTEIRFNDIEDLDVDIDQEYVEITKSGSGRPVILKIERPFVIAKIIFLLTNAEDNKNIK